MQKSYKGTCAKPMVSHRILNLALVGREGQGNLLRVTNTGVAVKR